MKNGLKRAVAFMLSAALTFTLVPAALAEGSADHSGIGGSVLTPEISGSDGVSALLSDRIQSTLQEEVSDDSDNRISRLEVDGSSAQVAYQAATDARLVVALYDEDGSMVTSGSADVSASEREAVVSIPLGNVPSFFTAKAYLIDAESGMPLSEAFTNNLYTESLTELAHSTVADYDEALVLNLDADDTTNFVVYNPGVTIVKSASSRNNVTELGGGAYRISGATDDVLGLQVGDILSLQGQDGSVLLIKLASIERSGDTVTITQDDSIALEDVFDVVKIEGGYDPTADIASLSELDTSVTGKITKDLKLKKEFKRDQDVFDDDAPNITLSMKGSLTLTAYVKLYLSFDEQYVEAKITLDADFDAFISGSTGRQTFDLLLEPVFFAPVPGVNISVMPSIVVDASLQLRFHANVTAALGWAYTGDGFENRSAKPKLSNCDISVDGKLFLGFSLEPSVAVFSNKVGEAKLTATLGFTFTGQMKKDFVDKTHACDKCIGGKVEFDVELSGSAKFLGELDVSAKILDIKYPLLDFYYSFTYEDWGFETCPHLKYPVNLRLWDVDENKQATLRTGAEVEYYDLSTIGRPFAGTLTTDANGAAEVYLPAGTYEFYAENPEKKTFASKTLILIDKDEPEGQKIDIYLEEEVYIASVTVVNEEGEKVSGAVIHGTGREKGPVTDAYGNARIPLRVGTYHLSVSKDGSEPVELEEFRITGYDVVLPRVVIREPRFKLSVRVLDEDWNAVGGIPVTVDETGETLYTNDDGSCTFTEKSGEYNLSAQFADGSFTGTASVTVNGRDRNAAIYLTKNALTVTVSAVTEENEPAANLPILVNGLESGVKTNELGEAVLSLDKGKYRFDISTAQWFGSEEEEIKKDQNITITLKKSWMEWSFDSDTGALSVWGEGAMPDYSDEISSDIPWARLKFDQSKSKWLTRIKSIEVNGLNHIGDHAFSYCLAAGAVTISDSVRSIGDEAFECCGDPYYTDQTLEIRLPETLERIGERAFAISGLKTVYIPADVRLIGASAFTGTSFTGFEVDPDNTAYTAVGGVLFSKDMTTLAEYPDASENTSYTVPQGVAAIARSAFSGSKNLTDIVLPETIISIGEEAFDGCSNLTTINIPDSVESIGARAFRSCSGLTGIDIGNGVKRIGVNAFYYCFSLKTVTIGRSFEGFEGPDDTEYLYGFDPSVFKVASDNPRFFTDGKALFEKTEDGVKLVRYANANPAESYIIPDGVTEISPGAFRSSSSLKKVVIADSVISIGKYAFSSMDALETLVIGQSFLKAGGLLFSTDHLQTVIVRCSSPNISDSTTLFDYTLKSFSNIVYMGDAPAMYAIFKKKLSGNASAPTRFYYPDIWDESLIPPADEQSKYETWIPYDVSSYDPEGGLPS